jgi:hypothetical protein
MAMKSWTGLRGIEKLSISISSLRIVSTSYYLRTIGSNTSIVFAGNAAFNEFLTMPVVKVS